MSRFRTYLEKTFDLTSTQSEEVMTALVKPLKKSIRINTGKISRENFMFHAEWRGWELTETDIPEVFMIDREDTSVALGRTIEHQVGWFYIQELAAAHPPFLLKKEMEKVGSLKFEVGSDQKTQNSELRTQNFSGTILDMCSSPGGKTTQLADYFPESLIIANEVNRSRTPQLFDNLDRMGYDNVAAVSCDGRFFQNFPEYFDAVLLDAPCSGEGTAFRDSSVIDHWHEKNIHRIAKLQKQLFETAMNIVKPGGFISYSTCTLNKEENENVITNSLGESFLDTFDGKSIQNHREEINSLSSPSSSGLSSGRSDSIFSPTLESDSRVLSLLFLKRFWPHIEHTGGFFASIFQKSTQLLESAEYPLLPLKGNTPFVRAATKGERETVERFVSKHLKSTLKNTFLYISKDGVFANSHNLGPLMKYFFFVHAGAKIGTIKRNIFTPTQHIYWHIEISDSLPSLIISQEEGKFFSVNKQLPRSEEDGYYILLFGEGVLGISNLQKGKILINT